ncbi:MAG: PorV/PorQ family protein [Flavobacteriales bacterium]
MKISKYITKTLSVVSLSLLATASVFAGNEQRAGQAGAGELLINPWASSSGWGLAAASGVRGIEASYLNVAGLARMTTQFEVAGSFTNWFSDIGITNAGIGFKLNESTTMGFSIMNLNYGDIKRTTVNNPGGTLGTFSPSNTVVGVQYAKQFTSSISGGVNFKVVSESTPELTATGVAVDVGVQYFTGENEEIKFGIVLKNIGTPMSYSGDGDDVKITNQGSNGEEFDQTYEYRASTFELPTQMLISGSYDFLLEGENRVTPSLAFASNSFSNDRFSVGVEYGYKSMLKVHAAYDFESKIFKAYDNGRETALTGLAAGLEFAFPYGPAGDKEISISYSFRAADPLSSPHAFGINLKL